MKVVDQVILDNLSREANSNVRLRKNLNLHDSLSDLCQRLFNAMEPGSYIRPHRHIDPAKSECFMAIRGRFMAITFDDAGAIDQRVCFGSGSEVLAIDLPAGIWHTVLALEPGSIFFETKPGPYSPLSDKDFAPWSPAEASPEVGQFMKRLLSEDPCQNSLK